MGLKLYGLNYSPFVMRVRIGLAFKGLDYRAAAIPKEGLKCPEFLAINPIGKIPALILEDGTAIVESETILTYLDEAYPEPPLLPPDLIARARIRTLIRVVENYLVPADSRLAAQRFVAARDESVIRNELVRLQNALSLLEQLMVSDRPGSALTLADCVLFPSLFLVELVTGQLGLSGIFAATPGLQRYFDHGKQHELLGRIYHEATASL